MAKFKVGDKVRIVKTTASDHEYSSCVGQETEIVRINYSSTTPYPYWVKSNNEPWCDEELELIKPMKKTFENLEVGDVLIDKSGDEMKVLAIIGDAFLKSKIYNLDYASNWYTKKEAQDLGWKIKGAEEEVEELTVEEVSKRLGKTVKIVK